MAEPAPTKILDPYMKRIQERCTVTGKEFDVYVMLNELYMRGFDKGVERTKRTFNVAYSHDAAMAALPAILAVGSASPEGALKAAIEAGRIYAKLMLESEVKP